MHADEAMESLVSDSEVSDTKAANKVAYHRKMGEPWKAIKATIKWMCKSHVYYCRWCGHFYNYKKVKGNGSDGHICGNCAGLL
jgi:hypothetical protein